jgi:hypothetical protein
MGKLYHSRALPARDPGRNPKGTRESGFPKKIPLFVHDRSEVQTIMWSKNCGDRLERNRKAEELFFYNCV